MKIKIISDTHINQNHKEKIPDESAKDTILCIAGDVCEIRHINRYINYIGFFSKYYKFVLLVLGNHEYYMGSIGVSEKHIKEELKQFSNVMVMDRDTIVLDDITFIGATLWTDLNKFNPIDAYTVERQLNDFNYICCGDLNDPCKQLLDASTFYQLHKRDLAYIKDALENVMTEKVVVMTHHAPSTLSVHQKWKNSTITAGFVSNLDDFILDSKINLYIHGHCHDSFDYFLGDTRVVCNPKGYGNENKYYNPNLIIEI